MYAITLNDGTKLEGFTLRNNCLVTDKPITLRTFSGKLNPVTISGTKGAADDEDIGGLIGVHAHMEVCYIKQNGTDYVLALADIPDRIWDLEQLKANQQFIAMMADIQL